MEISHNPATAVIDVAIAALWRRHDGGVEVLITRRPHTAHLGGSWELPGGKVRPCEAPAEAAVREVAEETGIHIAPSRVLPLITVEHAYPDRRIRIAAFLSEIDEIARIRPFGVLDYRWVPVADLRTVAFPAANSRITEAIFSALSGASNG
jgi:mutator protein MutT